MKFKKVEIKAFRAYNEVADGTFDFSIGNNEYADLVGIYAPNGFGKTSFYDAVEWGVTKNIHRLLKKHKFNIEHAKSERNINSSNSNKQYILRNRYADPTTDAYVQLSATNFQIPLKRTIDPPRAGSVDYKFKDSETVNRYFQKVILSQEWIDAFLKEDDAAARYDTFIEYFGNQKLDTYRKKLVELIAANAKQIADLKGRLVGVQKEMDFSGDLDILRSINDKIGALQSVYSGLQQIESDFSETEFIIYERLIAEFLQDLSNRKDSQGERLQKVSIAISGSEKVWSLEKYVDAKDQMQTLPLEVKSLQEIVKRFDTLAEVLSQIKNNVKAQKERVDEQNTIQELVSNFQSYFSTRQEIIDQRAEQDAKQNELQEKQQLLSQWRGHLTELELRQEVLQQNVLGIQEQLRQATSMQSGQESARAKQSSLQKQFDEQSEKLKSLHEDAARYEGDIKRLTEVMANVLEGRHSSESIPEDTVYSELLLKLQQFDKELVTSRNALTDLNAQIQEKEAFQHDIQKFITLGAEIVDKGQSTACPLCNHDYKEYSKLAQSIAGNQFLSAELQALLVQRTLIEKSISDITLEFKRSEKELVDAISKERSLIEVQLNGLRINEAESALKSIYEQLIEVNQGILRFVSILGEKTFQEYFSSLSGKLREAEQILSEETKNVALLKEHINSDALNVDTLQARLRALQGLLSQLTNRAAYKQILGYFNTSYPGRAPSAVTLLRQLITIRNSLQRLKEESDSLLTSKADIESQLNDYQLPIVQEALRNLKSNVDALNRNIKAYEFYVKNDCGVSEISLDAFEGVLRQIHHEREVDASRRADLDLIQQQIKNVLPYLSFEKAKVTEVELKTRIQFLTNTLGKELEKERKKVGQHLHDEIKAFFYEDLINELYARIDPHPEYRKIKFMCDFKEDKPKLNVCVCADGKDELLIPNLYFSTAQLNILSLSIFLAKALNVFDDKNAPVNCIFIDDPIQSMDSINILSTIDLIRSLVVNNGKQIIISTHDENFFNLLQKKIPAGVFKSKFIELETFGKVKLSN